MLPIARNAGLFLEDCLIAPVISFLLLVRVYGDSGVLGNLLGKNGNLKTTLT
jgi:hypothetical protein